MAADANLVALLCLPSGDWCLHLTSGTLSSVDTLRSKTCILTTIYYRFACTLINLYLKQSLTGAKISWVVSFMWLSRLSRSRSFLGNRDATFGDPEVNLLIRVRRRRKMSEIRNPIKANTLLKTVWDDWLPFEVNPRMLTSKIYVTRFLFGSGGLSQ